MRKDQRLAEIELVFLRYIHRSGNLLVNQVPAGKKAIFRARFCGEQVSNRNKESPENPTGFKKYQL